MTTTFRSLACACVLLLAAPASAQERDPVVAALQAVDRPQGAEFWQRRGDAGRLRLEALVVDAQRPLALRRRAVYALRFYGLAARPVLEARLADRREDAVVRRYAVLALVEALGASAIEPIAPYATDAEPIVRSGVLVALARLGARDEVARALAHEQHAGVRHEATQALERASRRGR